MVQVDMIQVCYTSVSGKCIVHVYGICTEITFILLASALEVGDVNEYLHTITCQKCLCRCLDAQ